MNILITGVAGLIGSKLADWIVENLPDVKVIGIDDLSGGYSENVNPKVTFYSDNILDDAFLGFLFEKYKPTYVFHFAAYAAEGLSPFIRCFNYNNNLVTTAKLVNQSIKHGVKRFVFTSSMSVYGAAEPPFIETYKQNPIDPYGVAKYACEMDIQIAGEQHNLDWCIFRPHNVYGDKQNIWDKYRNVLGIWMYQNLTNKPLTIYGDGSQTRAFSYIDDCVPFFWKGAIDDKASKQIFNIGGDEEITINDACDLLLEVMGNGNKIHLEKRHEVKDAWVSHEKIKSVLGFKATTDLRTGLSKMWNWAKDQPIKSQKLWNNYELDVGIYSYWRTK
jgi:UDP-glucose 4-epimerase